MSYRKVLAIMHSQLRRRTWRHRLNKIKSQLEAALKQGAKKDPPADSTKNQSK